MNAELSRFERIVQTMCKDWDCDRSCVVSVDENGWTWVMIGRNASHDFSLGHNADGTEFALKAFGESGEWDEENNSPMWETHIHRNSPTIEQTLKGAYYGHL